MIRVLTLVLISSWAVAQEITPQSITQSWVLHNFNNAVYDFERRATPGQSWSHMNEWKTLRNGYKGYLKWSKGITGPLDKQLDQKLNRANRLYAGLKHLPAEKRAASQKQIGQIISNVSQLMHARNWLERMDRAAYQIQKNSPNFKVEANNKAKGYPLFSASKMSQPLQKLYKQVVGNSKYGINEKTAVARTMGFTSNNAAVRSITSGKALFRNHMGFN